MTNAQRVYLASVVGTFVCDDCTNIKESNLYTVDYKDKLVMVFNDGVVARHDYREPFTDEELACFDRELINQVTDEVEFIEGVLYDVKQSTTSNVR